MPWLKPACRALASKANAGEQSVNCECSPQKFGADYVRKPLLSREGANVTIRSRGVVRAAPGGYGSEGFVYQGVAPLPAFDGRYPVIGAWIVGDEPAGIGIREDDSPITRNSSRFVPHYFA